MSENYGYFMKKEELHKSLNSLAGILRGIVIDGIVNERESEELKNWYELHKHLINNHPFNEIVPVIDLAFSDQNLDIEEAKSVLWLCDKFLNVNAEKLYFDLATSKIQRLQGIMHGIISDGKITDEEISSLDFWLSENSDLSGLYPYDEVYKLVKSVKDDGVITDEERNTLKAFFSTFVDTRESVNLNEADVEQLQESYSVGGVCANAPDVKIAGKNFCFTGSSQRASRDEIIKEIEDCGGKYLKGISKKLDYLIVGNDGNPCWAFSCYGRKVEKAMELQKNGVQIEIIDENDFWKAIEACKSAAVTAV